MEVGIYDINKARDIARGQSLDLVEISPKADPPVCKIIDYSKFKYEQKKMNYLIMLQRWKFRKEFTETVRYWQYLIQEQVNPGHGQRGRFRQYQDEEKKLITKYISPEQIYLVEKQLETE